MEADLLSIPDGAGGAGVSSVPAELWFPRGLDVSIGSRVLVKKTRVINGAREPVTGTLLVATVVGDTTVTVDTTTKFEAGDEASLITADAATHQRVKIKSKTANILTLYAESSIDSVFAIADTITVETMYALTSILVPHGMGPVIKAVGQRIPLTDPS